MARSRSTPGKMSAADAPAALADRVEGAPHPNAAARLFGQAAAEEGFRTACRSGRLPHGWLLAGPEGVGKATLAYRIARAVIAGGPEVARAGLDPPPDCAVAARIRAGAEPALRVLRRTLNAKTGTLRSEIVVEDLRAVIEFLQYSNPGGGWRVVIVDAADEMNRSSSNALLKSLEEPPEQTLLLLVSHSPLRLLPTIRSRCRRLDLAPLDPPALAAALEQAGHPVGSAEAEALAALTVGSAGRSVAMRSADGLALYARILAALSGGQVDRAAISDLADAAAGRDGRERAERMMSLIQILLGRLARTAVQGPPAAEAAPGEAALLARLSPDPAAARAWAEAACRTAASAARARAVNLDPGRTILDTFLDLDAVLEGLGVS